jgi:hypothetical protein
LLFEFQLLHPSKKMQELLKLNCFSFLPYYFTYFKIILI